MAATTRWGKSASQRRPDDDARFNEVELKNRAALSRRNASRETRVVALASKKIRRQLELSEKAQEGGLCVGERSANPRSNQPATSGARGATAEGDGEGERKRA